MKKTIIIIAICLGVLLLIGGIAAVVISKVAVNQTKQIVSKSKAQADISSAQMIGSSISRAFAEGKISEYKSNQELSMDKGYGKLLVENYYLPKLPVSYVNPAYKYYVSLTKEGEVRVTVGQNPESSVQLFPKPDKYEAPYDNLNQ